MYSARGSMADRIATMTAAILQLPAEVLHEALLYLPIRDVDRFAVTSRRAWAIVHEADHHLPDAQHAYLWKALFKRDFDLPVRIDTVSPSSLHSAAAAAAAEADQTHGVRQEKDSTVQEERGRGRQEIAAERNRWKWKQEATKRDATLGVLASRANAIGSVQPPKNGHGDDLGQSEESTPNHPKGKEKSRDEPKRGEKEDQQHLNGNQPNPTNALEREMGNPNRSLTMSELLKSENVLENLLQLLLDRPTIPAGGPIRSPGSQEDAKEASAAAINGSSTTAAAAGKGSFSTLIERSAWKSSNANYIRAVFRDEAVPETTYFEPELSESWPPSPSDRLGGEGGRRCGFVRRTEHDAAFASYIYPREDLVSWQRAQFNTVPLARREELKSQIELLRVEEDDDHQPEGTVGNASSTSRKRARALSSGGAGGAETDATASSSSAAKKRREASDTTKHNDHRQRRSSRLVMSLIHPALRSIGESSLAIEMARCEVDARYAEEIDSDPGEQVVRLGRQMEGGSKQPESSCPPHPPNELAARIHVMHGPRYFHDTRLVGRPSLEQSEVTARELKDLNEMVREARAAALHWSRASSQRRMDQRDGGFVTRLTQRGSELDDAALRARARERVYDAGRIGFQNHWGPFEGFRTDETPLVKYDLFDPITHAAMPMGEEPGDAIDVDALSDLSEPIRYIKLAPLLLWAAPEPELPSEASLAHDDDLDTLQPPASLSPISLDSSDQAVEQDGEPPAAPAVAPAVGPPGELGNGWPLFPADSDSEDDDIDDDDSDDSDDSSEGNGLFGPHLFEFDEEEDEDEDYGFGLAHPFDGGSAGSNSDSDYDGNDEDAFRSDYRSSFCRAQVRRKLLNEPHRLLFPVKPDWRLIEGIQIVMHCNLLPLRNRKTFGAAFSLPRRAAETESEWHDRCASGLIMPSGWDMSRGRELDPNNLQPAVKDGFKPCDWARVEGVWIGTYSFLHHGCWLNYQSRKSQLVRQLGVDRSDPDSFDRAVVDGPRHPSLERHEEATGELLQIKLTLEKDGSSFPASHLPPPTCDEPDPDHPTLFFRGRHYAIEDHSSTAVLRGTSHGWVRPVWEAIDANARRLIGAQWCVTYAWQGEDRWEMNGFQCGPPGTRGAILGLWTDADHEDDDDTPSGPFTYWRSTELTWKQFDATQVPKS